MCQFPSNFRWDESNPLVICSTMAYNSDSKPGACQELRHTSTYRMNCQRLFVESWNLDGPFALGLGELQKILNKILWNTREISWNAFQLSTWSIFPETNRTSKRYKHPKKERIVFRSSNVLCVYIYIRVSGSAFQLAMICRVFTPMFSKDERMEDQQLRLNNFNKTHLVEAGF